MKSLPDDDYIEVRTRNLLSDNTSLLSSLGPQVLFKMCPTTARASHLNCIIHVQNNGTNAHRFSRCSRRRSIPVTVVRADPVSLIVTESWVFWPDRRLLLEKCRLRLERYKLLFMEVIGRAVADEDRRSRLLARQKFHVFVTESKGHAKLEDGV